MLKLFVCCVLACFIGCAAIVCPDGNVCDDEHTCCIMVTGLYGCCPDPDAVCCKDKIHCCPNGYICDIKLHLCFQDKKSGLDNRVGMLLQQPARKIQTPTKKISRINKPQALDIFKINSIMCPDQYSICPTGTTCCLLQTGRYGCCQYSSAVCCNDHIHCCPHNYVCKIPYCAPKQQYKELPMKRFVKHVDKGSFLAVIYNVCPDGKTRCDGGNKCCPVLGGKSHSCCVYEHGVCCSDGLHCCPEGFTCNLITKKCRKKLANIPMGVKVKAKSIKLLAIPHLKKQLVHSKLKVINCAGGKYLCLHGETCCKLEGKVYGCCPQPAAVCCEDHLHCCPHGSKCDVKHSKCIKASGRETMLLPKRPAIFLKDDEIINALIQCPMPDETHYCVDTSTCCPDLSGTYSCCPIKNAICCASKIFCCPQNSCCGMHGCGTCNNNNTVTVTISGIKKNPMKKYETCPDKKHACPLNASCCLAKSGVYKCCPSGSKCKGELCISGHDGFIRTKHIDAFSIVSTATSKKVSKITCADNKTKCDDKDTCCNNIGTHYLCCPFVDAVCCINSSHCCPNGYTCGPIGQGICNKNPDHHTSIKRNLYDMTCPDHISTCPDNNTCCKLKAGAYGCCPIEKAVCCTDQKHCCPPGYKCNGEKEFCIKDNVTTIALIHVKSISNPRQITCPDGLSKCAYGSTCCKFSFHGYGCCPLLKAVCCKDQKHCCPNKFKCVRGGYCSRGDEIILASLHTKAIQPQNTLAKFFCPDGVSECFSGETCCILINGRYGCCPLSSAVCCADEEHCCPHGYICDGGFCTRGSERLLASKYRKPVRNVLSVKCPDGEECPDGDTCCELGNILGAGYGCCPLLNAVCCSDHEHCCPHGYTCGSGGFCTRGSEKLLASKHTKPGRNVFSVKCPDGEECPDGDTCCKFGAGYGCCPLPSAVCCPDHEHCCPNGYTCGTGGYCIFGLERIVASTRIKAITERNDVICPDGLTRCHNGSTCCEVSSGGYGCCPLPKAVCCPDKVDCCPNGYTCSEGYCVSGQLKIPAIKHTSAIVIRKPANLICPDHKTVCDQGTCCEGDDDDYICCPLPDAVCCADNIHCCPTNFKCVAGGLCAKNNEIMKASKRIVTSIKHQMRDQGKVHACPDKEFYCPDGSTCCHRLTTGWGCCPLPNAVCCADEKHCCRQGFSCTGDGKCKKGGKLIAASKNFQAVFFPVVAKKNKRYPDKPSKMKNFEELRITMKETKSLSSRDQFLLNILKHKLKTCADGYRKCLQYETCCPTNEGYICCPLFKAVCCGDRCCPNGSTCSKQGACERFPVPNQYIKFEASSDVV